MPELNPNARNYIELVGKNAWVVKMKKKLKGKAQIKARPTDRRSVKIDKDKVMDLFGYLKENFEPINGVSKEAIHEYLKERVNAN